MRAGTDGIALDHRSEWLYYGPLNGRSVHRVRVADLLNEALSDQGLGSRIERYAERPNAGGMSIDAEDNLYLTEVEHRAVGVIPARDRTYRRLAEHPDMLWPDGLSAGPDGYLYVTVDQLSKAPPLNGGKDVSAPPYLLMRFKPLAPGRLGH
jgi:sugar lactone lactonase YvrE